MGSFKCDRELCQKLLAEFTGTAMLMTLGCTCSVGFPATTGTGNFNVNYSIGWGLSYMAAIHTFAFLSGAHLNPWVSLGAGIFGIMEITTMCLYLVMQVLGCLLGTAFALFVAPDNAKNICVTYTGQPIGRVIGFEFLATSLLMFAYCALWDRRSNFTFDSMSLRVGLIIGGLCYAIVSIWLINRETSSQFHFIFRVLTPGAALTSFVPLLPHS